VIDLIPYTRAALLIEGDALLVVTVHSTPAGARSRVVARIEDFLSASADAARGQAKEVASDVRTELVLVAPSVWCASRPVPIASKQWDGAKEARDDLVEAYFPFGAADAYVGVMDLNADENAMNTGCVFALPKKQLAPWLERITQVFGRSVREIVPATMAIAGLGLQSEERAVVIERDTQDLATTLEWGRPRSIAEPFDETEARGASVYCIGTGDEQIKGALPITREQLAIAACVLPFIPGVSYRAMGETKRRKTDRRFPLAAALTLVTVAGVVAEIGRAHV